MPLPGKMPVEQDMHMHAALLRVYQGIDHAVSVFAQKVADQKQREFDGTSGAVYLGQDGMVRTVILAVH